MSTPISNSTYNSILYFAVKKYILDAGEKFDTSLFQLEKKSSNPKSTVSRWDIDGLTEPAESELLKLMMDNMDEIETIKDEEILMAKLTRYTLPSATQQQLNRLDSSSVDVGTIAFNSTSGNVVAWNGLVWK